MVLSYAYRLRPSKKQHRALEHLLESQRQLYNAALQERQDAYRLAGVSLRYIDQTRELTEWRQSDTEAYAIPVNVQRSTLKRLDDAYQSFFRHRRDQRPARLPRFRGKSSFDSFGFREFVGITLKKARLRFKGMPGSLRVHFHRPLPFDDIKGCIFKREAKGWNVCFLVDAQSAAPRPGVKRIGLDLGLAALATLSDGTSIPNLRVATKAERRVRVEKRKFARRKPGSHGRRESRLLLRKLHAATARRRANHLHQSSAKLVLKYDIIAVERLNIAGLARSANSKQIHDAAWSKFISMLRYKAERAGARIIEVDAAGTTQMCSSCGIEVPKSLNDRVHRCPGCGLCIDRDQNAARNILHRAGVGPGLRNVADCGMRAGRNLELS